MCGGFTGKGKASLMGKGWCAADPQDGKKCDDAPTTLVELCVGGFGGDRERVSVLTRQFLLLGKGCLNYRHCLLAASLLLFVLLLERLSHSGQKLVLLLPSGSASLETAAPGGQCSKIVLLLRASPDVIMLTAKVF